MPFVLQGRNPYLLDIKKYYKKDCVMNWIFEAYSNVYKAALMQDSRRPSPAASASLASKATLLSRLFERS
jgi:hypothetical protein